MPTQFSRTLRTLEADRGRGQIPGLLLAGGLLAAWALWCVSAHITLYEVTSTARLEVDRAVYPIQSPLTGRVSRTYLEVGRQVHASELLVELDTSAERLQVNEERSRLAALGPREDALRQQIAAEEQARAAEQEAARVAAEEAKANARQSEAPAAYNAVEEERLRQLRAEKLISERDYQLQLSNARQTRYTADRDQITVQRIQQEQRTKESDRESRIRAFQTEIVQLDGDIATSRATIQRLENEIERRVIRAPADGRLGQAAILRIGAVLREGDQVAALVPDGRLIVVAQFAPAAALGRIAPGQSAGVRLDGFPWAQYGPLHASVSRVASEVRDGTVRVELAVDPSPPARIPLQHGLPGSVEVQVEKVTPATLILRTAGNLLASPRSAYPAGNPSGP